jgi:predicted nucleic acid-binding protein
MNASCVIVDANIAFKTLISGRGDLRIPLSQPGPIRFYAPRFLFVELFKHKDRLMRATRLNEDEGLEALYSLISRIEFITESNIPLGIWVEAHRLCKDVDDKDTPYVALTLHLDGRLWTDDDVLKEGLRPKGFNQFYETR